MAKSSHEVYEKFVDSCSISLEGENPKFLDLIKARYEGCDDNFRNSDEMIRLLEKTQIKMSNDESRKFVHLRNLLEKLKEYASVKKQNKKRKNSSDSGTESHHAEKIPKLKECSVVVEKFSQDDAALFHQNEVDRRSGIRKTCCISDGNFTWALNISVADGEQVDSLRENLGLECRSWSPQSPLCKKELSHDRRADDSGNKMLVHYQDNIYDSDSSVLHTSHISDSISGKSPRKSVSIVAVDDIAIEGCIKASAFCCINGDSNLVINDVHEPESWPLKTDFSEVNHSEPTAQKIECTSQISSMRTESPRKKSALIVNMKLSKAPEILIIESSSSKKDIRENSCTKNVSNKSQNALTEITSVFLEESPHLGVHDSHILPHRKLDALSCNSISKEFCSSTLAENPSFQKSLVSPEGLDSEPLLLISACTSSTTHCENEKTLAQQVKLSAPEHVLLNSEENVYKKQDNENDNSGSLQSSQSSTHHQNSCQENKPFKRVPLLSSTKTVTSNSLLGATPYKCGMQEKAIQKSLPTALLIVDHEDCQADSSCMGDKTSEAEASADEFQEHCVSTDKNRLKRITKLEHLLVSLRDEIEKCQDKELTLDDLNEEDTSYIYEDKLKKKFVAVWSKLCELTERSVTTGRPTERTIRYSGTRYKEINRRIEKFLNKKKVFPDFHDIKSIIKLTNKKCNLNLNAVMINNVARDTFVEIGEMLQMRRHEDFISTFGTRQTDVLRNVLDPYLTDPDFRKKVDSNRQVAKSNLDTVIAKYAKLQYGHNLGDDSKEEDSDNEEEQKSDGNDNDADIEMDVAEDGDENISEFNSSDTGSTSLQPGTDYNPKDLSLGCSSYLLTPNKDKNQFEETYGNNIPSLKFKDSRSFNKDTRSEMEKADIERKGPNIKYTVRKAYPLQNECVESGKSGVVSQVFENDDSNKTLLNNCDNSNIIVGDRHGDEEEEDQSSDSSTETEEDDKDVDKDVDELVLTTNESESECDTASSPASVICLSSDSLDSLSDCDNNRSAEKTITSSVIESIDDKQNISFQKASDKSSDVLDDDGILAKRLFLHAMDIQERETGVPLTCGLADETACTVDHEINTILSPDFEEGKKDISSQIHQMIDVSSSIVDKQVKSLAEKKSAIVLDCSTPTKRTGQDSDDCIIIDDTPKKSVPGIICVDNQISIITELSERHTDITETSTISSCLQTAEFICTGKYKGSDNTAKKKLPHKSPILHHKMKRPALEEDRHKLNVLTKKELSKNASKEVIEKWNTAHTPIVVIDSVTSDEFESSAERIRHKTNPTRQPKDTAGDVITLDDSISCSQDLQNLSVMLQSELSLWEEGCLLKKEVPSSVKKNTKGAGLFPASLSQIISDSESLDSVTEIAETPEENRQGLEKDEPAPTSPVPLLKIQANENCSSIEDIVTSVTLAASRSFIKNLTCQQGESHQLHPELKTEKLIKKTNYDYSQNPTSKSGEHLSNSLGKNASLENSSSDSISAIAVFSEPEGRKRATSSIEQEVDAGGDSIDEVCASEENAGAVREQVNICSPRNAPNIEIPRKMSYQNYSCEPHKDSSQDLFKDSSILEDKSIDKGIEISKNFNEPAVSPGAYIQQNVTQIQDDLLSHENEECSNKKRVLVEKHSAASFCDAKLLVNDFVEDTYQCSVDEVNIKAKVFQVSNLQGSHSEDVNDIKKLVFYDRADKTGSAAVTENSDSGSAVDRDVLSVKDNTDPKAIADNGVSVIAKNVGNALCNTASRNQNMKVQFIRNITNETTKAENKVLVNEKNESDLVIIETAEDESRNRVTVSATGSQESGANIVDLLSPCSTAETIDDFGTSILEGMSINGGVLNFSSCLQHFDSESSKMSESDIFRQKIGTEREDIANLEQNCLVSPCSQSLIQSSVKADIEETDVSPMEDSDFDAASAIRSVSASKGGFTDIVEKDKADNCKMNKVIVSDSDSKVITIQKSKMEAVHAKKVDKIRPMIKQNGSSIQAELVSLNEEDEVRIIEELSSVRGVRSSENSKEDDRRLVDQLLLNAQLNHSHSSKSKLSCESNASKLTDAGPLSGECWEEYESACTEGSNEHEKELATNISGALNTNSLSHASVLNVECEEVSSNEETLSVSLIPVSQSKTPSPPDPHTRVRNNKRSHEAISESVSNLDREHYSEEEKVNSCVIDVEALPQPKKQKVLSSGVITDVITNVLSQFPSGGNASKLSSQVTKNKLSKNLHSNKQHIFSSSKRSAHGDDDDDDDVVIMDETPAKNTGHPVFPMTLNKKKQFSSENQAFTWPKASSEKCLKPTTSTLQNKKHPVPQTSGKTESQLHILSSNIYNKSLVTSRNQPVNGSHNPPASSSRPLPHSQANTSCALPQLMPRVPIPSIQPNRTSKNFSRFYPKPHASGTATALRQQFSSPSPVGHPGDRMRFQTSNSPMARHKFNAQLTGSGKAGITSHSTDRLISSPKTHLGRAHNMERHKTHESMPSSGPQVAPAQFGGRVNTARGGDSQQRIPDSTEIILGDSDEEADFNNASSGLKIVSVSSLSALSTLSTSPVNDNKVPNARNQGQPSNRARDIIIIPD